MPVFCLGIIPLLESEQLKGRLRNYVIATAILSVLVNFLSSVQYWRAFNNHPFIYLIPNTDFG
jgi:type III secretory pathway component EscT